MQVRVSMNLGVGKRHLRGGLPCKAEDISSSVESDKEDIETKSQEPDNSYKLTQNIILSGPSSYHQNLLDLRGLKKSISRP